MDLNIRKLKIKLKHLAAEARIIRHEARQVHGMERWNLNHHRTTVVRDEARATLLAYGFLRGREYSQLEGKRNNDWNFHTTIKPKALSMAKRYGRGVTDAAFEQWLDGEKLRDAA